jgi:ribosomal protein L16/L10AE
MFEMAGVAREISVRALELAAQKLPVKTRIIEK